MNKKRFFVEIFVLLLAILVEVLVGTSLTAHLDQVTVQELFIKFTLVPMVLSFIIPFIITLVYNSKFSLITSYLFALFLYLYNYIIIDSNFTTEVISQIMLNSDIANSGVSITSSTDFSSMISTVITILALTTVGIFFAKLFHKRKQRKMEKDYD